MRDYASETADAPTATTEPARDTPLPQQRVVSLLLNSFRTRFVSRAALATQVFLTLAAGFVLVAAFWVKAFG